MLPPYSGLKISQARNKRKIGRKQTSSRHDQDNQHVPEKGLICAGVGRNRGKVVVVVVFIVSKQSSYRSRPLDIGYVKY
jgi:hypothetical protein